MYRIQRYYQVYIGGKKIAAHRIIWKLMTGETPEEVDHINRDGHDNRWANLREVDRSLNCVNQSTRKDNKYGRGIHFCETTKRFRVQVQRNKVRTQSIHKTLEEAISVRDEILNQS